MAEDSELEELALTREQVLRSRGYDLTSNGHVAPLAVVEAPGPRCLVCDADISQRVAKFSQARTCGEDCSREHQRRYQAQRNKDRPSRRPQKVAPATGVDTTTLSSGTPDRLVLLVTALATAGRQVSVRMDDVVVTVG